MKTINKRMLTFLFVLVGVVLGSTVWADEPPDEKGKRGQSLLKTTGTPDYQLLNIGNLYYFYRSNGNGAFPPSRTGDGVVFPRVGVGGAPSAIYEDGLMWGGKVYTDAAKTRVGWGTLPFRVGGNEYNQGNQAGWVTGTGVNAAAVSANLPEVRAWRIRRDWNSMTESEYEKDAEEWNETKTIGPDQISQIRAQYAKDWDEWSTVVPYGAPYIERNGTPGFQKPPAFNYDPNAGPLFTAESLITGNYDEPGVAGADLKLPADQVLWMAFNDLNRSLTTGLYGTEPMGLEVQLTMWGYKRTDALGNMAFKRFRIINKGGVDTTGTSVKGSFWIDSMYVVQWADPDLGNAGDDILGCDSTLGVGFVYNGFPVDNEYKAFNLPPASSGYDFLAGPLVAGAVSDSGVFNLKRVYGKKNIPMTAFSFFSAGSPLSDPRPRTWAIGANRWYKMMRGFAPQDGPDTPYPYPPGATPNVYPYSGDVTKPNNSLTNQLDGLGTNYSFTPGDRRLIMSSGPFSLAPGDTQEVVVALVVGLGADRISSVSVLKFNDKFVQNTFNGLFVIPTASSPTVKAAQLDRKVVLDWGWDPNSVAKIENSTINPGAFVFEGYNVYQSLSSGASLSASKRILTVDVINSYSTLQDEAFDQSSGLILTQPVQFGTNSGVDRVFEFSKDYVRDQPGINNGQEYYLSVTAYFRSTIPGYAPAVLESSPARLTVIPQQPSPGTILNAKVGDAISTTHSAGTSEGTVSMKVVDPSRLTGDTYRLTFTGTTTSKTYTITNVTKGTTLFSGGKPLGSDWGGSAEDFVTADGMKVYVQDALGVSNTISAWTGGTQWLEGVDSFTGDGYEGFTGAILPGDEAGNFFGAYGPSFDKHNAFPIMFRFDSSASGRQKAYRLVRNANLTNNNYVIGRGWTSGTVPLDTLPFVDVPFKVFDMTNPSVPRQLDVSWRESNRNGVWNPSSGGFVEWINVYSSTYLSDGVSGPVVQNNNQPVGLKFGTWTANTNTAATTANIATGGPLADIVYICDFSIVSGRTLNQDTGRVWIYPRVRFSPSDQYTWSPGTKAAVTNDATAAKDAVGAIQVFPNPYYAFNEQETNRFSRFVTFSHLPANAKIRIFNLAGQLVKTIVKDGAITPGQFVRWDLNNQYNFPVASGIYIAHIDMPDLGASKTLKIAVIQEQEVLTTY